MTILQRINNLYKDWWLYYKEYITCTKIDDYITKNKQLVQEIDQRLYKDWYFAKETVYL